MKKIYYFLFLLFIAFSCEKESVYNEAIINNDIPNTEYNNLVNDIALAVNHALTESEDFRSELKGAALEMFDGDYDVLFSNIIDKKITPTESAVTKGFTNDNFTIGDLLNSSLNTVGGSTTKALVANSGIGSIIDKYPNIQMSIPVNIETWDGKSVLPVIVVPDNYKENVTKYVPGYDKLGRRIWVDAINEPVNQAYIVIGNNERGGNIGFEGISFVDLPDPKNLSAQLTEAGIQLTWSMSSTKYVTGYNVYRMAAGDKYFAKIGEISSQNSRGYNDLSVSPNRKYSYYVEAFHINDSGCIVSEPSEIVTIVAPPFPEPVESFEAIVDSKNCVELRWINNNNQYNKDTKIYKRETGSADDYKLLTTLKNNESYIFDRSIQEGKRVTYRVSHSSFLGESPYQYDVVQMPYRDVNSNSSVYIKQIKIGSMRDLRKIESWIFGKPEFYVTVSNVDRLSREPYIVADKMDFKFNKRKTTSQLFKNRRVLEWKPDFWYDMLSFNIVEYDNVVVNVKCKVEMGVGYNTKNKFKTDFSGDSKVEMTLEFKNKVTSCGNAWLSYYDNPEQWLLFQNYGIELLISEKP